MKTSLTVTVALSLISASLLLAPAPGFAEEKEKKSDAPSIKKSESTEAAKKPTPFRGKVATVDATAKTFTIGKRTFHVTEHTQISKDGKPATLADIKTGEAVTGSARKGEHDQIHAVSVYIGGKPEAPKKEKKE